MREETGALPHANRGSARRPDPPTAQPEPAPPAREQAPGPAMLADRALRQRLLAKSVPVTGPGQAYSNSFPNCARTSMRPRSGTISRRAGFVRRYTRQTLPSPARLQPLAVKQMAPSEAATAGLTGLPDRRFWHWQQRRVRAWRMQRPGRPANRCARLPPALAELRLLVRPLALSLARAWAPALALAPVLALLLALARPLPAKGSPLG